MRWEKYTKEYHYAKEISYADVMIEIKKLFEGIIKYYIEQKDLLSG